MDAGAFDADEQVAFLDVAAVDDFVLVDYADREAREVEALGVVDAGHLRRFAAEQRAEAFLAGADDAVDDGREYLFVELAAGRVVEEEERARAYRDEVVDVHRDEILPEAAVEARRLRELELRADAVGASGEAFAAAYPVKAGEASDSADAVLILRVFGEEGLYRFDPRVAA